MWPLWVRPGVEIHAASFALALKNFKLVLYIMIISTFSSVIYAHSDEYWCSAPEWTFLFLLMIFRQHHDFCAVGESAGAWEAARLAVLRRYLGDADGYAYHFIRVFSGISGGQRHA
jgi:hypothetical protein